MHQLASMKTKFQNLVYNQHFQDQRHAYGMYYDEESF